MAASALGGLAGNLPRSDVGYRSIGDFGRLGRLVLAPHGGPRRTPGSGWYVRIAFVLVGVTGCEPVAPAV
jgi:hypothetical protein